MPTHKLDETFDMEPEEISSVLGISVEIPKDPTIRSVVTLALDQYKNIIEESKVMEPADQLKHLELAKEYLKVALTAMHNESDLEIKHMNAVARLKKGPSTKEIGSEEEKEQEEKEKPKRISRSDLYDQL